MNIKNFDGFHFLSKEIKKITDNYNDRQYYTIELGKLDIKHKIIVDDYFYKNNLPAISWENSIIFKRRSSPHINFLNMHVDWYRENDKLIKTSLIIPIEGCKNTIMYWAEGEYELQKRKTLDQVFFHKVVWKSIPKIIEKVEISDFPIICRVDLPHGICTSNDNTYRITLALKLQGNPSLESVVNKFII